MADADYFRQSAGLCLKKSPDFSGGSSIQAGRQDENAIEQSEPLKNAQSGRISEHHEDTGLRGNGAMRPPLLRPAQDAHDVYKFADDAHL